MRNTLIVLAFLVVAPLATAQEGTRIGVGIGVSNTSLVTFNEDMIVGSPISIYLPITFSSFRLEPELGLFRASTSTSFDDADFESEVTTTLLQLGTGAFILQPMGSTNLYFGGRVGITRLSFSSQTTTGSEEDEEEESSMNFFIGPAVGGEYMFSENFSLGGEAQLLYTSFGEPDEEEGEEDDDFDVSASLLNTRGVFFVRWHF